MLYTQALEHTVHPHVVSISAGRTHVVLELLAGAKMPDSRQANTSALRSPTGLAYADVC